jgi:hypothetical protein
MKINLKTIFCGLLMFTSSSLIGQSNQDNSFKPTYGSNVGEVADFRNKNPKPANASITITQDFVHKIGDVFEGGVIFKLWKDSLNIEHGLIISTINVSSGIEWSNITKSVIGKPAFDKIIGLNNLTGILNQKGHISSAAMICDQFVMNGKDDWYLPSLSEMIFIMEAALKINKGLKAIKGAENIKPNIFHWTSTEFDANHAYSLCMHQGNAEGIMRIEWQTTDALKRNCYAVRAIRSF